MRAIIKFTVWGGFAALALAGCKQENNYPVTEATTDAAVTEIVPVPGPTTIVAVPVPGPTSTVTATATSAPSDSGSPNP